MWPQSGLRSWDGRSHSWSVPRRAAGGESFAEALSALMMLGFAKPASEKVLRALVKEQPQAQVEELIRMALKRL